MLLTEERVQYLILLAEQYASANNLLCYDYVAALINPDTIGDSDAGQVVETLIRYHLEWLKKSN